MNIECLKQNIESLSLFAGIKRHPAVKALLKRHFRTSAFLEALLNSQQSFGDVIADFLLYDDNPFTRKAALSKNDSEINKALFEIARYELTVLKKIYDFNFAELEIPDVYRPLLDNQNENSFFAINSYTDFLRKNGFGIFAKHRAFFWNGSVLKPAVNPDNVSLKDLTLFEDKRQVVISNTKNLLAGKMANNILLYGDRGTGKSATVKAIANDYAKDGLRIIEVQKAHLSALPEITALLKQSPLKFIIFIDDLSFESQDDSFTHLKGLLEGGIETRPQNIVVYATSNRRHLVKEKFADRPAGGGIASGSEADVRAFDTMQEQLSLSDRFGVTLVFTAPSQDEYLDIARFIAEERGLLGKFSPEDALKWERWFNGRSPRTARQYIDWLEGGKEFPWAV